MLGNSVVVAGSGKLGNSVVAGSTTTASGEKAGGRGRCRTAWGAEMHTIRAMASGKSSSGLGDGADATGRGAPGQRTSWGGYGEAVAME